MTKKRPRVPSTAAVEFDETLSDPSNKLRRSFSITAASSAACFNDSSTADVVLRLHAESSPFAADGSGDNLPEQSDIIIHLHSGTIRRSKYFAALLSERWQHHHDGSDSDKMFRFNLGVSSTSGSVDTYLTVLQLLYTNDFANTIESVSIALDILPVALELLFEDCVKSCVKFLEALPWSEEEEMRVLNLIPLLSAEESQELLARVSPEKPDSCEEMLHGLILAAIHNHPNMAFVKAFVAKILRDLSSRESANRVLERAFGTSLKVVKESLEAYSSPDFRGDHNETEAIQRLNLHTAMTNGRHLLWLVERMIELRVADSAVKEWSEQASFTADLQRAFRDDAWRNIVPGLPAVVLRCTCKLANAVAAGAVLVARQSRYRKPVVYSNLCFVAVAAATTKMNELKYYYIVHSVLYDVTAISFRPLTWLHSKVRMKLVKDWLPVLIVCKDNVSPLLPSHRSLYQELEETFLRIISTLPMSDAKELLQQCLSFSTRNVEDCPHLITAFNTWFRRATQPKQPDHLC